MSDAIPRTHCFSLGDFHDFDRCVFKFFVCHHLQKKYELAEGSANQAIGSLLDLALKKLHLSKAYHQPADYLVNLINAAEVEIRQEVEKTGSISFYGQQVQFLTPETITKAQQVFRDYLLAKQGHILPLVATPTTRKPRPFWKTTIFGEEPLIIWGGPDSIEMADLPEIVDYKYREDSKYDSQMDMDLMPKLYTFLCAQELLNLGYSKARFCVRLWHDPTNNSYYEEFDLPQALTWEEFFKDKMLRILRTDSLSFCENGYCPACKSQQREEWVQELKDKGWIKTEGIVTLPIVPVQTA